MGIGVVTARLYQRLRDERHLQNINSVIELGSQDMPTNKRLQKLIREIVRSFGTDISDDTLIDAKKFHQALGCNVYKCIDADGRHDSLVFDLNKNIKEEYGFSQQFDLVTNHGTTEHVFDQCSCFRNIHNLCKVGGYMFHDVPFEGFLNHGFFNYQPSLFADLAVANNYEYVGIYYSTSTKKVSGKYTGNNFEAIPYSDKIFDILAEKVAKGQFPVSPMKSDSDIFVILRKTTDDEFRIPFDGLFSGTSKIEGYERTSRVNHFEFFDQKFDMESEIERTMGQSRLVNRIKLALLALTSRELFMKKINNQLEKFK